MKNLYIFSLAFCLMMRVAAYGQQRYMTIEKSIPMDERSVNAWVINVGDEPVDELKKEFTTYCKKQFKVKLKKQGNDMLEAKAVTLPAISGKQGDLKVRVYTEKEQTMLAVAFMPGYDIALNSQQYSSEMENLRKFTKHFVKGYKMNHLSDALAENESRKKLLEKTLQRSENEQKKIQQHLGKISKQLASKKTDDAERFELNNDEVSGKSRLEALDIIVKNHHKEMEKVEKNIQSTRMAIGQLETLFADPAVTEGQAKTSSVPK